MSKMVILGGGISGASVFYHMRMLLPEWEVVLLDKNSEVGGINRNMEIEGLRFMLGSRYIFNLNEYTEKVVRKLARGGCKSGQSVRSVYFSRAKKKFLKFPVQLNTAGLPMRDKVKYLFSLLTRKSEIGEMNFENWAIGCFGEKIARDFLINHNYKCWKVDPFEIDYRGVSKKVMSPNVWEMLWGGIKERGHPNTEFLYPVGGIGGIVKEMINIGYSNANYKVYLESFVESVNLERKEMKVRCAEGLWFLTYDVLVNTIPLPGFINLIVNSGKVGMDDPVRLWSEQLRFNVMASVMLVFKGEITDRKDHFIYVPEKKYRFSRISIPRNFDVTACPEGYSSLLVEVAFAQDRKKLLLMPQFQERWIRRVLAEIYEIFPGAVGKYFGGAVGVIDPAYIITDEDYFQARKRLMFWLEARGIISIGRFARWDWSRIEDVIPQSRELVLNLRKEIGQ